MSAASNPLPASAARARRTKRCESAARGGTRPASRRSTLGEREAAALRRENDMLRQALEDLPHGLCVFDADDRLLLGNDRYRDIWALPPALGHPGTPFAKIMAANPATETESSRARTAAIGPAANLRQREWLLPDGRTVEVTVRRRADGSCVALHEDVTEQRRVAAQLTHLARHDALTGLANRQMLIDELERQLPRTHRGETIAVLCLDLDRFKVVNDTLGHAAGDALLREVAARLRSCVRGSDLVSRPGGDEFVLLQFGAPQPAAANALARRVIEALGQPFELDGQRAHIGTTVGIAVAPFDGEEAEVLLRGADLALYHAKTESRGTVRFFEPEMDALAQRRRGLEDDLRRAVHAGELRLHYQPQVSVDPLRVTGVEALLRWQHPQRGMVSPQDFVPLAEETGLIVPIGRWVLHEACRQASEWPADVRVAVNVSAVQFRGSRLLRDVSDALEASGLDARRLEVEVTESVMIDDSRQALETLRELRALGVRIAMDDFGTGYSSLSYLRSFPFDRIKIDRSFVRDMEANPDALSIVRAVAGLGRSLGMATTVEGVETEGQLQAVRREGCAEAQGYLFSRPLPADEIPAVLAKLDGREPSPPGEETHATSQVRT